MKNKALTVVLVVLLIVCLGVFIFFGYKLYSTLHGYKVAKEQYTSMSNQFVTTNSLERTQVKQETDDDVGTEEEPPEISPINVDFDAIKNISKDIVGWIYSPDTVIDYPVVQGPDNDKYLYRFMDGSYNPNGTIFLDFAAQSDFSTHNNIIYGHNMNDGSMFHSIKEYAKQEYYDAHPVMYLNTPLQDYKLEIFSAFVATHDSYAYTYAFENEDSYAAYLYQMRVWSFIETSVIPTREDKIVTLSTCSYEFENARFVVQAVMTPIGYDKGAEQTA